MTLEEIRLKVPKAKYLPDENCKICKGTGFHKGNNPCICLFVDHQYAGEMAKMISDFAKSELDKLHSGQLDKEIEAMAKVLGKINEMRGKDNGSKV